MFTLAELRERRFYFPLGIPWSRYPHHRDRANKAAYVAFHAQTRNGPRTQWLAAQREIDRVAAALAKQLGLAPPPKYAVSESTPLERYNRREDRKARRRAYRIVKNN